MIRWKYVLPRLSIVCGLLLLAVFGTGPALRWSLVQSGQAATGAKVDIEDLKLSWTGGSVTIEGIQIADPKSPHKNAFQAGGAFLDLNVSELLRKRFVVDKAILTDIAFDQTRSESGELERAPIDSAEPQPESPWVKSAKKMASDKLESWIDDLAHLGVNQLETQFETVQVAKELSARWPQEYDQMQGRVTRLEEQFKRIKGMTQEPNRNPLRMVEMAASASRDVQQSLEDIDALYRDVQRLKQQIPVDKQRLMDAKRRDQEKLKQMVKTPQIKGEDITKSLFGNDQGEQINSVLSWVQWIRSSIPNPDKDFSPERSRGVDVKFTRDDPYPALWIREAGISGTAPIGSHKQGLSFKGTITDLSTHPARIDRPVTIELETQGAEELKISAELDRTQQTSVDHIRVEIPSLAQKEVKFGSDKTMLVKIPASHSQLELDLTLIDREVRGSLKIVQHNAKLKVEHVDDRIGGTYVHSLMGASLESIEGWDVEVAISGTLDSPELKLDSSLGPRLAAELNQVVNRVVDDQRKRAEDYLDKQIDTQLAKLDSVIREVEEMQDAIQQVDRDVSAIKQNVARLLGNRTLR